MRFKAPDDRSISIALTSGHTAVIGPEFEELPAIFHREAIAAGAIPEGAAELPEAGVAQPGFDRAKVITDAMLAMLDGNVEGDFTGDGKPDTRKLSARVGFSVQRDERDALWAKVVADVETKSE